MQSGIILYIIKQYFNKGVYLNKNINVLTAEEYTQKQFFKDSVLNSFILFKHMVLDYFKNFIFSLTPVSRYEFWCFSIFTFISIVILSSLTIIISIAVPFIKLYVYGILYLYIFIIVNIAVRVYASRLVSVKKYINQVETVENKILLLSNLEHIFKNIFLSTKLYITIAYVKIFTLTAYILNEYFIHIESITHFFQTYHSIIVIHLLVFIFKVITVIYAIFMVSPSISRTEYLEHHNITFHKISYYQTWYTKAYFVDYLTLAASIFSVIAVGHLLIIGYSFSCHLIMSLALLFQSVALLLSGRFFGVVTGFISLVLFIGSTIFIFTSGIDFFNHQDNVAELIKYYQITISLLFFGIFYYSSFDRDVLKMIAIIGCFLSALFLWEDQTAIKGLMVYDNHTIPVLIYGLVGLFTFFIYLIRVANSKGLYQSDSQYLSVLWSDFRTTITLIKSQYIYMIIFYASIGMLIYVTIFFIYPIITPFIEGNSVDNFMASFFTNVRRFIAFYMLLGLYLLFKHYNDVFPMLLIAFVVALEMYVILYPSLNSLLPADTIYPLNYIYTYIYGLMFILSISLSKYSVYLSIGFSLSIISFLVSLINILFDVAYLDSIFLYNLLFISLIIANIFAAIGSYKKIKQESV